MMRDLLLTETTFPVSKVTGGLEPSSPLGLLIITIGIIFTVGLPILMIFKGNKN